MEEAVRRLPGPDYYEVLGWIHRILQPANYVEIGVRTGTSLRAAGAGTVCIGIDPNPAIAGSFAAPARIFSMTSDEFFAAHDLGALLGGPVALAFIDGLHLFEQVLRDFANLERHSNGDSVILLHDCLPLNAITASRDRTTHFYSGDTWKAVLALHRGRPDLRIVTVRTAPTGLCLVTNLNAGNAWPRAEFEEIVRGYHALDYGYYTAYRDEMPRQMANEEQAVSQWLRRSRAVPDRSRKSGAS